MAFQQGLSGLNAASQDLDVVGNNIANASTVGFKGSSTQFADVFAASLSGAGGTQVGIGTKVGSVRQQFTQGNITVSGSPLDIAINGGGFFRLSGGGSISYTRSGEFQLDKNGFISTSDGHFLTGYVTSSSGVLNTAAPANLQISTSDLSPNPTSTSSMVVNLDSRSVSPAVASGTTVSGAFTNSVASAAGQTYSITVGGTTAYSFTSAAGGNTVTAAMIDAGLNTAALTAAGFTVTGTAAGGNLQISRADGTSFNIVVADTMGTTPGGFAGANFATGTNAISNGTTAVGGFSLNNPLTFNSSTAEAVYDSLGNPHTLTTYFVKTTANAWAVFGAFDGTQIGAAPLGTLYFKPDGSVDISAGKTVLPFNVSAAVTTGAVTPLAFTLDFNGTTQFGSNFSVNAINQNGYASGRLAGFNIGTDGIIMARYTNGQTANLGQVVLTNFANAQGLQPLGNSLWAETSDSGAALVGVPNSGTLGVLQSGAREDANVDLTAELVKMITAQRVYQANAQSIKTQDAVLQTLVNLR